MFHLDFSILLRNPFRRKLFSLFQKYRSVLKFILAFVGTYFLLVFLYQYYLDYYHSQGLPDYITQLVARQTEAVISTFGYTASVAPSAEFPLMELYVNEAFIARIIEGCNSISLVILFLAFMLSFIGKPKPTFLYIFAGTVIIYGMNIVRIAVLSIGIYELPQYSGFLHQILFPLIIYGTVFLLWLLWIYIYTKSLKR